MERTRYGSDGPLIARRVADTSARPGSHQCALSFDDAALFAGSLVSTVDDLARWQAALDSNGFLSAESRRRMWTPVTLPDGTATRYGFGWGIWRCEGHAVVEHGGAINGFVSANMRWPDDHVYVAVLSNATGPGRDPRMLALRAASLAAGIPADDRRAVARPKRSAVRRGIQDSDGDDWTVRRHGNRLEVVAGPSTASLRIPACPDCFLPRPRPRSASRGRPPAESRSLIDEHIGPIERAVRQQGSVMSCGVIDAGPRVQGTAGRGAAGAVPIRHRSSHFGPARISAELTRMLSREAASVALYTASSTSRACRPT